MKSFDSQCCLNRNATPPPKLEVLNFESSRNPKGVQLHQSTYPPHPQSAPVCSYPHLFCFQKFFCGLTQVLCAFKKLDFEPWGFFVCQHYYLTQFMLESGSKISEDNRSLSIDFTGPSIKPSGTKTLCKLNPVQVNIWEEGDQRLSKHMTLLKTNR